jgi:XapX domain-containing protein
VLKIAIGLLLGFAFGAVCRWFNVPAPSPPTLFGAFLVVSVTLGYGAADRIMSRAQTHSVSDVLRSGGE